MNKIFNYTTLVHPFTCMIAGPTKSGKTHLLMKILRDKKKLIFPNVEKIVYCYSQWQEDFDEFKSDIEFYQGIFDTELFSSSTKNLIIFDDLMEECGNDKTILNLFTRGSHHKNISVILLTQNLFNKGKYCRTISLNSHYLIIFNNPRDKSQINHLARQMYPTNSKFLIDAYDKATKNGHGYLFIDNNQFTDPQLRIQSNITEKIPIVYI